MSDFYTLHKGIFRDITEVDVLIDLIESQQATIAELNIVLKASSAKIGRVDKLSHRQQATIAELQFEHDRAWSSQKLYREEAEASRATITELEAYKKRRITEDHRRHGLKEKTDE